METTDDSKYVQDRIKKHLDLEEAAGRLVEVAMPIHSRNDSTVLEYVVDAQELDEIKSCVERLKNTTGGAR